MSVRVRFAPSPTGHIHVGNTRTALFNYLYARNMGGTFVLRIEDTDFERSSLESEKLIYEDMQWLLMDWDEGPVKGGDFGPYRQTERFDLYNSYVEKLLESGDAYRCFCTKETLDAERDAAQAAKENYNYSGRCRNLSEEEVQANIKAGKPFSIRFNVKKDVVRVSDAIKGEIDFNTNMFGDFIIVRPDGAPIYNFVVVIDDALMNISHVIRGDDHLNNTPKQILIFEALGFELPVFIHIPMILGPDKSKLSKRHGNTSVEQFREQGYLADALFNYLALLSWSDEQEREILSKDELIKVFSLDRVSKSAAIFDFEKLKWMNGIYIRTKDKVELTDLCLPFMIKDGLFNAEYAGQNREKIESMIETVKDKLELLSDASEQLASYFSLGEYDESAEEILKLETTPAVFNAFKEKINGKENLTAEEYKEITKDIQKETGAKGKALFMAIRVGISGRTKGPDMDKLATILSVAEMTERINTALKFLGA